MYFESMRKSGNMHTPMGWMVEGLTSCSNFDPNLCWDDCWSQHTWQVHGTLCQAEYYQVVSCHQPGEPMAAGVISSGFWWYGGVQFMGNCTPKSSICFMDFPWNKPSIYLWSPIDGNPHKIPRCLLAVSLWLLDVGGYLSPIRDWTCPICF